MKYILEPFFKYLWLFIKTIIQIIVAIIVTIIYGIPTLILCILYFIFVSIWEFKLSFYKFDNFIVHSYNDSIICDILWSTKGQNYKSYFHAIWNITRRKTIATKLVEQLIKKLN